MDVKVSSLLRKVAGILLSMLLGAAYLSPGAAMPVTQAAGSTTLTISQIDDSAFPDVTAYLTVSDGAGIPIAGLNQDAFGAAEDGHPIAGLQVEPVVNQQRQIALVLALDLSGSMKGTALDAARSAAKAMVNALGPQDTVAILGFGEQVRWLLDSTTDRASALQALDGLTLQGDTALNDAIYEAASRVGALPPGRRAVVILTDGRDTASKGSQERAITRAQAMQVPVYTIGFGPEINADALEEIARQTGGMSIVAPGAEQLAESFQRVFSQLKQQYALSYRSEVPADMLEHELLVRVTYAQDTFEDQKHFLARAVIPVVAVPGLLDGTEVSGEVPLAPQIVSETPIRRVTYLVDGQPLAEMSAAPFDWEWDTTTIAPGPHAVEVRAVDELGRESAWRGSVVVAPPSPQGPTVSLRTPSAGAVISGTVTLAADVGNAASISRVEFWLDDEEVGRRDAQPYEVTLDTGRVAVGSHTLSARAYGLNSERSEEQITVQVVRTHSTPWLPILLGLLALLLVVGAGIVVRRLMGAPRKSPAALIWQLQSGGQQRLQLREGENTIGKPKRGNTTEIDARTISKNHAIIRIDSAHAAYQFRNLSVNSTSVINGKEITGDCLLMDGDQIELGDEVLTFLVEGKL